MRALYIHPCCLWQNSRLFLIWGSQLKTLGARTVKYALRSLADFYSPLMTPSSAVSPRRASKACSLFRELFRAFSSCQWVPDFSDNELHQNGSSLKKLSSNSFKMTCNVDFIRTQGEKHLFKVKFWRRIRWLDGRSSCFKVLLWCKCASGLRNERGNSIQWSLKNFPWKEG